MASLPGATHPLRLGDYQLRVCASIPLMGETRFKIGGWSGQRDANDHACATRPALLAGSAQRVAAICHTPAFARDGGLMAYANSLTDMYRPVVVSLARILKGEVPPHLPVVQPHKF